MSDDVLKPALLIDASASNIQVGILDDSKWLSFQSSNDQALNSIFSSADKCFKVAGLSLADIKAFIYCEGPGSILGIRLAAMALKTWCCLPEHADTKVYSYNSMLLTLERVKAEKPEYPFQIVTESRMKKWNCLRCEDVDAEPELQELGAEALSANERSTWYLPQRSNGKCPDGARPIAYDLENCVEMFTFPLLKISEHPDAVTLRDTEYKQWSAQPHKKV